MKSSAAKGIGQATLPSRIGRLRNLHDVLTGEPRSAAGPSDLGEHLAAKPIGGSVVTHRDQPPHLGQHSASMRVIPVAWAARPEHIFIELQALALGGAADPGAIGDVRPELV